MQDHRRQDRQRWGALERQHHRSAAGELARLETRPALVLSARPMPDGLFRCPGCSLELRLAAADVGTVRACSRCSARWIPTLDVDETGP